MMNKRPNITHVSYDGQAPIVNGDYGMYNNPPIKLPTKERLRRMRDERIRK